MEKEVICEEEKSVKKYLNILFLISFHVEKWILQKSDGFFVILMLRT